MSGLFTTRPQWKSIAKMTSLVTLVMPGQRWNEPGQGKELADLLDCWSNDVFSVALNVSFSLLLPLQFFHPLFPSTPSSYSFPLLLPSPSQAWGFPNVSQGLECWWLPLPRAEEGIKEHKGRDPLWMTSWSADPTPCVRQPQVSLQHGRTKGISKLRACLSLGYKQLPS